MKKECKSCPYDNLCQIDCTGRHMKFCPGYALNKTMKPNPPAQEARYKIGEKVLHIEGCKIVTGIIEAIKPHSDLFTYKLSHRWEFFMEDELSAPSPEPETLDGPKMGIKMVPYKKEEKIQSTLRLDDSVIASAYNIVKGVLLDSFTLEEINNFIENIEFSINGNKYGLPIIVEQAISKMITRLVSEKKKEWKKCEKAYGGCHNCYAKGYCTYRSGLRYSPDFEGDREHIDPIKTDYVPCDKCDRGKQFALIKNELTKGGKNER